MVEVRNDNYVQAKFNYGIKTQEAIFNDTQDLANLIFQQRYEVAYEFAEIFLNKLSGEMGEDLFKKIKVKLIKSRKDYVAFSKWKSSGKGNTSRYSKAVNKLSLDTVKNLRETLLDVDMEIRKFLKKKGISTPKETDEMRSMIEGKE